MLKEERQMHNLRRIIFVSMFHTAVVSSEVCNLNRTFSKKWLSGKAKTLRVGSQQPFSPLECMDGDQNRKSHSSVNAYRIPSSELHHILNSSIQLCFWCSNGNSERLGTWLKVTQTHKGRKYKSPVWPLIITHVLPLVRTSLEHVMRIRPFDYKVLSPALITSQHCSISSLS